MIVLDTNVISEPLKPAPAPAVLDWLDRQTIETLYISAISLAELRYGIAALPVGRRRDGLTAALEGRLVALFGPRILSFDRNSAQTYAAIRARTRSAGITMQVADGYIAATAAAHGFMIATRDVAPFEAAGLTVLDPWRP